MLLWHGEWTGLPLHVLNVPGEGDVGAVFIPLEVANSFLSICDCFSGHVAITLNAICCRPMPASPVSAPHSRTTVVTMNNRGGKAAICTSKDRSDSKLFLICTQS